jgi:hypothetical protein
MNTLTFDDSASLKSETLPLACKRDAGVFSPEQAGRYETLRGQIAEAIQGIEELPNGYALRFPAQPDTILSVAEFIVLERRCCCFFHFALEIEPDDGPLWLRLTGGNGVKEFLQAELGLDY